MQFASGKPLWRAKRNMSCTPGPIAGGKPGDWPGFPAVGGSRRDGEEVRRAEPEGLVVGALAVAREIEAIALGRLR